MAKKTDTKSDSSKIAPSGKGQALQLAVDQIEKQFGKGSIMRLGDAHRVDVETIPTGSISLDLALGGGIPKGRVIEIYGPESSVKPRFAYMLLLKFKKEVVLQHTLMLSMRSTQLTLNALALTQITLLLSQPDSGEQALK
jgi:recombination protein RecA